MSASKCNYTIFTRDYKDKSRFQLSLNDSLIPFTDEIRFLGITFDSHLTFKAQINEIRNRCHNRLNILKILSNKKRYIKQNILGNIYKALIGSIIDYSFPIINIISESNSHKLQVIQNNAIRTIFKLKFDTSSNTLAENEKRLKLKPVKNRLQDLSNKYIKNSLEKSNNLIVKLVNEYLNGFTSREENISVPLSNCHTTLQLFFPNFYQNADLIS